MSVGLKLKLNFLKYPWRGYGECHCSGSDYKVLMAAWVVLPSRLLVEEAELCVLLANPSSYFWFAFTGHLRGWLFLYAQFSLYCFFRHVHD